jgi:hypothetical protein
MAICVSLTGFPQSPAQDKIKPPSESKSSESAKVPPEVDQALRARVAQFYQDHVEGKYRAADQLVAEDSKDAFFGMPKPHIKSFEIIRIDYSENFTKAEVALMCPADWFLRGQKIAVKIPLHDIWKLDNGQWFWHVTPAPNELHTPFGVVRKSGNGAESPLPEAVKDPASAARAILSQVNLDKSTVTLKINRQDSAEVLVKNGMPGAIRIQAESSALTPGFSSVVEKEQLGAGETGKIVLRTEGLKDAAAIPDATVRIRVEPTGQILAVTVQFVMAEPEPPAPASQAPAKSKKPKKKKKTSYTNERGWPKPPPFG